MKKLPKGISDFKELMVNHYVYVDKTAYIERLENSNDRYIHFLRPRRFGKSLFTSMLSCYYDCNKEQEFEMLFASTYIYQHPTSERHQYCILNFDFSGLLSEDKETLKKEFYQRVKSRCQKFLADYHLDVEIDDSGSAAAYFSTFLDRISACIPKQVYVLIDEYDQFANEMLSFAFDDFSTLVSKNGYVRKFYETLKMGTASGVIGRIFITGVSPITMDSMTSGYNISTNLSLDHRFHEMMGFTYSEMETLLEELQMTEKILEILPQMKQYYDGYRFSISGKAALFNPNMALYYIDALVSQGQPPKDILDRNIFNDYKKLEQLVSVSLHMQYEQLLQALLDGEHPNVAISEVLHVDTPFTKDDFYSLLFYLGYLTIAEGDDFGQTLKIPNMAMQKIFIAYFRRMLEDSLAIQLQTETWRTAVRDFLKDNQPAKFVKAIEEVLHKYPDRMFQRFHERNVQQIADMIVEALSGVDVDLEWMNDNGYGDFMMIPSSIQYPNKLIEFKYVKADYSEHQLQEAVKTAKAEIQKYRTTRQMVRRHCDCFIMVFAKDRCIYIEEV